MRRQSVAVAAALAAACSAPSGAPDSGAVGASRAGPDAGGLPDAGERAAGTGAFLWQGFDHEWLRTVLGFRVPHRISRLDSYIAGEAHGFASDWDAAAMFHAGQATGVDGNYMKPRGLFGAVYAAGLGTSRGTARFSWTDDASDGTYPRARTEIRDVISVPLDAPELAGGTLDRYAAVLRGIALDTRCDDAKQPEGEACNSDGMWPYRFYVALEPCRRAGAELECPIAIDVFRAWTPNRGGIPGISEKPMADKLDFELNVHYAVLGGDAGVLAVTQGEPLTGEARARDEEPLSGIASIAGEAGYARGAAALTGFGFELFRIDDAEKHGHLGRYIGGLRFEVGERDYRSATGGLELGYAAQVWVPDTVVDSGVRYWLHPALVQIGGEGARSAEPPAARGSLCIESTDEAPWFSTWKRCDDRDKAPERAHHAIPIRAP